MIRVWLSLAAATFAVWWAAVLVKLAGVDSLTAAWWRFLVGGIGAYLALRVSGGKVGKGLYLIPSVALTIHMVLWFASLRMTDVLASTAIVCTYPAFIAFVESLRGEVKGRNAVGVTLVTLASLGIAKFDDLIASLLSLFSSLAVSVYFLSLKRERRAGTSALELATKIYLTSAAFVSLLLALIGKNPIDVPPRSLPYLIALGLVPMLIGHTLLNYSLRYLPATVVTSSILTEPLGAALISFLVLGEVPSKEVILFSLVALMGTFVGITSGRFKK